MKIFMTLSLGWPRVKHHYELNFSSLWLLNRVCSNIISAVCHDAILCNVVHYLLFIVGRLTRLQSIFSGGRTAHWAGEYSWLDLRLCSLGQTALGRLVTFIVIYSIWILNVKKWRHGTIDRAFIWPMNVLICFIRLINAFHKVHAMNDIGLNNNTLSNNLHIHRVGHPACTHWNIPRSTIQAADRVK